MADVQGQAETQPVIQVIQPALTPMNPHEAVAHIAEALEKSESGEAPRDDQGRFIKAEAKAEPDKQAAPEEAKEEAAAPEEAEREAQPTRKLKLKYKGEDKEVDEPEAIELAQKGYDYTQKSQALAKEREEFDAKIKSESEAVRNQYEQRLEIQKQTVLKLVDQEALNADLNKLALEDPARAQQLFFKKLQIQQTLQSIEAEQGKIIQQRQGEAQEKLQAQAKEAVEKLQDRIPNWNNDLYGKILKGAVKDYGFKDQEVNAITDHRAIEVLHDAMKWREYQSAKPATVDKRVAAVPKVQKPGSAEKPDPNASKIKESMARLEKTGSRSDAVDHISQLIQSGRL